MKQENNLISPIVSHQNDKKKMVPSPFTPGKKENSNASENSFDSFEIDEDPLVSQASSFDPLKTPPDSPLQTDSNGISLVGEEFCRMPNENF